MFIVYIIDCIISSLIYLIPLVLAVAFYTLAERKIMASIQRRQGPKIIGFWGLLQPLVDGSKLVIKEIIAPSRSNSLIFLISPMLSASISFASWSLIPFSGNGPFAPVKMNLLLVFVLSSLNVYSLILAGWSSNSKYALLGSLRAAAQLISYEIVFGLALVIIVFFTGTANLTEIVFFQYHQYNFLPLLPVAIIFFVSMFAETNRAPFDLPEAESEIVAGYNVEYASTTFAMFFLAEYSNMILMSALWVILFLGGWHNPFTSLISDFGNSKSYLPLIGNIFFIKIFLFLFIFVLVRAILPRYRFDQPMWACWQAMFPVLLGFFILLTGYFISGGFTDMSMLNNQDEHNTTVYTLSSDRYVTKTRSAFWVSRIRY